MKNYIIEDQFELQVARGKVKGASYIHKFGAVSSLSINTTGSVWDIDDTLYPWSAFDTAGVLVAAQANVSDNGKVVTVLGLDENFELTQEDFTLSSAGTVTGTKTFKRVYRAFVSTGSTNVGNVTFSRGGTNILRIQEDRGQTLMAVYTVPAGYTAYLHQGVATAQTGADATGFMYVRYNSVATVFRVGHTFEVSGDGGEYHYEFKYPVQLPEKSDIDVRLTTRSNNGRFTAAYDMLLIKNDTPIPGNTDYAWP
jgi:hypothetical protein